MAVKTGSGQCISLVNGIMNTENTPKQIVESFIDLSNMIKGLIDENQQPYIQQELKRLFPSTTESREPHRVGAGESFASTINDRNTSFATLSTKKQTISEIWRSKACGDSH